MHCETPTFPLVIAGIPYSQGSQCHEENEVKELSRFPLIDDFHQLLTYLLTYTTLLCVLISIHYTSLFLLYSHINNMSEVEAMVKTYTS